MAKEDKAKKSKVSKTKDSNAKDSKEEGEGVPYEVRMQAVTVISKPMASEKKVEFLLTAIELYSLHCVGG